MKVPIYFLSPRLRAWSGKVPKVTKLGVLQELGLSMHGFLADMSELSPAELIGRYEQFSSYARIQWLLTFV